MSSHRRPTSEQLQRQIEGYVRELPHYQMYAAALRRVLHHACAVAVPEVLVQTRAKDVSSFIEKFIRKFERYPDAANQMTDLCGGRVIVQTLAQVKAVKLFVEQNFEIRECDDKGLLLSEDRFGYRDMHYLIRLLPSRAEAIGFTLEEIEQIGQRIAEVQVRSLVQHAWADILHDRTYKPQLKLSNTAKRTGARLAAIMEDGDRSFDRLADELDGMVANYTAYATREDVKQEIEIQESILKHTSDPKQRPRLTLRLARLLGPCGDYDRVIEILTPYTGIPQPLRAELLVELGHALCRVHRKSPDSTAYGHGQTCLQEAVAHCGGDQFLSVPNLRSLQSLRARALSFLAWSWANVPGTEGKARQFYREAAAAEPANPYHLANQLSFEILCERNHAMLEGMQTTVRQAITVCREHAIAGTELPYALFSGGRLSLLMGHSAESLGWYARGLSQLFEGSSCVSADVLDDELDWLDRVHFGSESVRKEIGWVKRLIALARAFRSPVGVATHDSTPPADRVLVLAGGAETLGAELKNEIHPMLRLALENFRGLVISGGTTAGIPGCIGEIAAELRRAGKKSFELIGYIPDRLPADAAKSDGYDRFVQVTTDNDFSPDQVLQTWEDLLRQGIRAGDVLILGIGGGQITAVEYRIGFALGAGVAAVANSGGASNDMFEDPLWTGPATVMALPLDSASIRAFIHSAGQRPEDPAFSAMAEEIHLHYVRDNERPVPENMRPWTELAATYRKASLEQARSVTEILRAAGFDIRPANGRPAIFNRFTQEELELMAELEHGRWNVDRLRNGWRPGASRDNAGKIHDWLRPWRELPENIREIDRNAIRAVPGILARAGLEVFRRTA